MKNLWGDCKLSLRFTLPFIHARSFHLQQPHHSFLFLLPPHSSVTSFLTLCPLSLSCKHPTAREISISSQLRSIYTFFFNLSIYFYLSLVIPKFTILLKNWRLFQNIPPPPPLFRPEQGELLSTLRSFHS